MNYKAQKNFRPPNNMDKENNQTNCTVVTGKKRPMDNDDLNSADRCKVRKSLLNVDLNKTANDYDIDWDEDLLNESTCSDIEQFKNQEISPGLNDSEFLRDLMEFGLESSFNKSESKFNEIDLKTFYGLPLNVQNALKSERKITELYEWQDTLMKNLISHNRNLVYCVPTSGGKTLVAELMIFREIVLNKRNALFIFPFISIVQEKIRSLIPFSIALDFIIEEYAGEKGPIPAKKRLNKNCLYIATYEKAHLLLTCLLEDQRLDEIGLVVVDELHMIGDGTTRGCTLESLLLLCILAKTKNHFDARLIAMSATLSNFNQIAIFLDAVVHHRDFRPVELIEYVKLDQQILRYNPDPEESYFLKEERVLEKSSKPLTDPDNLTGLVLESIPNSPLLIFCATKVNCENVVNLLCKHLPEDLKNIKKIHRSNILNSLLELNDNRICETLQIGISFGIAYHHSGLTSEEREIIESGFLKGHLCVIVCTSTLAAGVNLPAQRVIIRSPYIARNFITVSQYKQMVGRSGRAGFCEHGESILMIKEEDAARIKPLFLNVEHVCRSSIEKNREVGISRIFLSLIHLGLAVNFDEVREIFLNKTLFGIQSVDKEEFESILNENMAKFYKLGLIDSPKNGQTEIKTTKLGKGAIKGLIDINKCAILYDELKQISMTSIQTRFHLFYIVAFVFATEDLPIYIDRSYVQDFFLKLNSEEKKAAELMGITEVEVTNYFLYQNAPPNLPRFFCALLVYELYKFKTPLYILSIKCRIPKGTLQNFFYRFSSNSMSLLRFLEELDDEWARFIRLVLPTVCSELCLCSSPELSPLLELPHVKIGRAKQLFNAGFKSLQEVAEGNVKDLRRKLDYKINDKVANDIIKYARKVFSDKADVLKAETKRFLKIAKED